MEFRLLGNYCSIMINFFKTNFVSARQAILGNIYNNILQIDILIFENKYSGKLGVRKVQISKI